MALSLYPLSFFANTPFKGLGRTNLTVDFTSRKTGQKQEKMLELPDISVEMSLD